MRRLLALSLLLASPAGARSWQDYFPRTAPAVAGACPRVSTTTVGDTQGYADGFNSGKCYAAISSMLSTRMIYRSHILFSDGMLMVFNSYGDGEDDNPNLTSAREFYFFPRRSALALQMDKKAGTVAVVMADGARVSFSPATAQISSFERGSVVVAPRIDPADRGGVEIPAYTGLMLDGGFRMGESPTGRPAADATFRDAQGRSCTVKNAEVFAYANGDHALKYADAELSAWLKTRCPALNPGF